MRLTVLLATITLLVCISIDGAYLSSLSLSSASPSTRVGGGLLFVQGDSSAFDSIEEEPLAAAAAAAPSASSQFDDDDDVAELLADSDEFEGAPSGTVATGGVKSKGKKKGKKGPSSAGSSKNLNEPSIENVLAAPKSFIQPIGMWEYVGITLVILYIVNYFIGSRKNTQVAVSFAEGFRQIIEDQFAYIGTEQTSNQTPEGNSTFHFEKESEFTYKLYASGRRFCNGMLLTLNLQKRHDLISTGLSLLDLSPNMDTFTLDIGMNDDDMENFTFALVKKKFSKRFTKDSDTNNMMTLSKSNKATTQLEKYVILNELPELEQEILNERVTRLLMKTQVEKHFITAHFTDQAPLPWSVSKRVLRFQFVVPSSFAMNEPDGPLESVQLLVQFAFHMVDRLGSGELSLTPAMRTKVEARRKKLAEVQLKATARDRQDQQLKRKEAQRAKEAEIIAKDPTSDLAKELIRKKEARELKMAKKAKGANIKMMR